MADEKQVADFNKILEKSVKNYLQSWYESGLFVKPDENQEYLENFQKVIERLQWNVNLCGKILDQYKDGKKWKTYCETMKRFGYDDVDLTHHLVTYSLYTLGGHFEVLGRFILQIIDKNELGLNDKSPYGNIISRIADKIYTDNKVKEAMRDFFYTDFRIAIAHEKWEWKDRKIVYKKPNDEIESLDINQAFGYISAVNMIMKIIAKTYQNEIFPKLEKN